MNLRSGILLGQKFPHLGAIDTVAEGAAAAAISRGGASKVYKHVDPNEDAALWATGPGGTLLAVADGHNGTHGARAAVEALARDTSNIACALEAPCSGEAAWCEWLYATVQATNEGIVQETKARQLGPAPTTLCIAILRPAEGAWAWAGVGDSHVFSFDGDGARDRGWKGHSPRRERAHFLGVAEESWHRSNTALGWGTLEGVESIVLATDGLSEHGIGVEDPAATVAQAAASACAIPVPRRAQWLAREVAQRANASHRQNKSGDNISTAVWVSSTTA